MKRIILLFLLILIICGIVLLFSSEPSIVADSEKTSDAVITDRAMSGKLAYLGVNLADGTALCLWDVQGDIIPEDIQIGDSVTVTYAEQDGFDRFMLLEVSKE